MWTASICIVVLLPIFVTWLADYLCAPIASAPPKDTFSTTLAGLLQPQLLYKI